MRTNTSGQYTLECHSAKCVYPWTTQCNVCRDNRCDAFKKQAHLKQSETTRKKKREWLCLGPCHKQENLSITRSKPLSKKGKVFVTGPYNAKKALMITGVFSQRWKLENYLHVIPSFLERATPSWWCEVLQKTAQCEHKKNDCWATQSRPMKQGNHVNQDFSANIAMIVAGTPSQTQKLHVNQTRVQRSSPYPGGMMFITEPDSAIETMIITGTSLQTENLTMSTKTLGRAHASKFRMVWRRKLETYLHMFITWTHRAKIAVLNTKTMTGSVTEKTRRWLPPCQSSFGQLIPRRSW